MAKDLNVNITGNASSYLRSLGKAQKSTSKFGAVAKAALISGAAAGMVALGKAAKIGWDEFNAGEQIANQVNAAIKSTGGVAGVTAKHVDELSQAMLKKAGIDDEATGAAQAQLLTFTKIGAKGGIFDKTTSAVADLATRLNNGAIPGMEQMSSTAILVGKAMNNPINGLTRLKRVGVEFTDQQSEQITKLQEAGKTMKAQKIILEVLEEQYGGSAKAAGDTFGGSLVKLRERLNNFLGDLTGKAIPYLQQFAHWIDPKITAAVETVEELMRVWQKRINEVTKIMDDHQSEVSKVATVLSALGKVLQVVIKIQLFWAKVIGTVWVMEIKVAIKAIGILTTVVTFLGDHARTAGRIAAFAFRGIVGPINLAIGAVQRLVGWVQDAVGWFTSLFNAASSTGSALGAAAGAMPTGKQPSRFALGGTVPGPIGAPRMILAHGGETVSMRGREPRGYGPIIVQVDGREILRAVRRAESRELRR